MSVINKHQNDQWLQCHSVSCAQLLNIGLNTEVYLYDLKMCDILIYPTYYHVTDLVRLMDSDYIYIYIYIYIYGSFHTKSTSASYLTTLDCINMLVYIKFHVYDEATHIFYVSLKIYSG